MTAPAPSNAVLSQKCKVVINCGAGKVIRAFSSFIEPKKPESLASSCPIEELLNSCVAEDGSDLRLDAATVKAVFFVSSFEGDRQYEPVRFYTAGNDPGLIWVEILFRDGEIVEGCVQNSVHHLLGDGFFLLPSSPGSNNLMIFINKAAMASYRVLGVRDPEKH